MMRITTILLLLIASLGLQAQEQFSYQVRNDISWKKVATVNFSDPFEDFTIENNSFVAPEPFSNTKALKAKLDANRKRKFNKLHKSGAYDIHEVEPNPNVPVDFNAMPRGGGGVPNDNNMAISNGGIVVSVINSTITMMDDTGAVLMYRTLRSVVRNQLPNLDRTFDPKIIYDPINDRFILVFLQGSTSADTRIIVGFTQNNDPTDIWNFYAVNGNPFGRATWSDYPIIGMNHEDFFITVNILRDGESWQEGFEQSVIWQIQKSSGYEGNDSLASRLFHDLNYNNKPIWSMCIVRAGDWETDRNREGREHKDHMHFLSVRPDASLNDTVFVQTIHGSIRKGGYEYDLQTRTTTKPYGVPPSAFQKEIGYRLQTNDTRVLDAFEQDGIIQYVQSTIIPETGMPGIFHGVFSLTDNDQVEANYIQSDTLEFAYPSIAYVGDDTRSMASVITFSHSSELHYPGTAAVFYNGLKGVDESYSKVILVKEGEGLINTFLADSIERWGDYTAVQRMYNEPGTAWLCGSHGRANNTVGSWIGKVTIDPKMNFTSKPEKAILFPNPVEHEVSLILELANDQNLSFNIYDTRGSLLVEMGEYQLRAGVNTIRLNMDDFRLKSFYPGMYILSAVDANGERIENHKFTFVNN